VTVAEALEAYKVAVRALSKARAYEDSMYQVQQSAEFAWQQAGRETLAARNALGEASTVLRDAINAEPIP
jgi:hypothetical protein